MLIPAHGDFEKCVEMVKIWVPKGNCLSQNEILQIAVPSAVKLTEIQIANDSVAGHLG